MKSMNTAVKAVLEAIPSNVMFDTHFVLGQLLRNHSDQYLRHCAEFTQIEGCTLAAHQGIGRIIKTFDGGIVQRQDVDAFSENIHGNASTCALWLKL